MSPFKQETKKDEKTVLSVHGVTVLNCLWVIIRVTTMPRLVLHVFPFMFRQIIYRRRTHENEYINNTKIGFCDISKISIL